MEELLEYRRRLLERYAAAGDSLAHVLAKIPERELHRPLAPGVGSPHRVAAHLRRAEAEVFALHIARILNEDKPLLNDIDMQSWMDHHYRRQEPLEAITAELVALRRQELAWLLTLPPAGWSRTGHHPVFGERTLQWWVEHSLAHAEEHLWQLSHYY